MRIMTASAIVAALALGTPAIAQTQGTSTQPEAQAPQAQSQPQAQSRTTIRSIQVVDVKELQPAVRSQVDALAARTSEQDLQSLRKSIDATPQATSALEAKGMNSSQVVAINIDEGGVLTLFAKKTT